ncbi:MAG: hypothetical protein Q7T05_01265, partial [Dehalococcoidia bacterium]|nr:hypothetical protein [Dehalococcoidia bacterium]
MNDYKTFTIERKGPVVTITFMSPPYPSGASCPWELGCLFSDLRVDNSIRVIVLTGSGGNFTIPAPKTVYH